MVLEASVICVDNSEWMRNGDYTPTRMEAQHDAVNLVCGAKTQQNPENTVAAVTAAGKSPEVLVTLTSDQGKLLSSLHGIRLGGHINFMQALQVSQLVLKHRQNKSQHQRIIFFVGSPINDDPNELIKLAKRLKKNNVAVDIVNFGEEEMNTEKLESFVNAINSNNNSHLINIPPGPHILSDIIITSPIITGGEDSPSGQTVSSSSATNDFALYGGVDPNLDPELALALKVSMEEARAVQEAETKKISVQDSQEKKLENVETSNETQMGESNYDDSLLAQAMSLSMQQAPTETKSIDEQKVEIPSTSTKEEEMQDLSEEQEMELALKLSQSQELDSSTTDSNEINKVMEDPNFVNSVLSSLPGVDPNDETIKNVLASLTKTSEQKDNKKEKK